MDLRVPLKAWVGWHLEMETTIFEMIDIRVEEDVWLKLRNKRLYAFRSMGISGFFLLWNVVLVYDAIIGSAKDGFEIWWKT